MEIDWTSRTVNDWQNLISRVTHSNFMQSWPFAKALRMNEQKLTRFAVLKKAGVEVGFMAIQEVKLGPLHIVNLHRGPIWVDNEPTANDLKEFAEAFIEEFPKSLFRRRRWMPEWEESESLRDLMKRMGFKNRSRSFETIRLDLGPSIEGLRKGLHPKWRNALSQAERAGLEVQVECSDQNIDLFLNHYQQHRVRKKFLGYSPKFLRSEIEAALPFGESMVLWAIKDNVPVAGAFIVLHGQSATYRASWTTDLGRKTRAHNLLLWEGVLKLKSKGINNFDLGGIDSEKAEGLTKFKERIGGELIKLSATYS